MPRNYKIATVFGGTGFIGRHLIRQLAKTGMVMRVPSRHPSEASFLRPCGHVGQVVPIACNIHDDRSVAAAVSGADIVINLIGILHERRKGDFRRTHVEAAGHIAKAAQAAGVERLVHISAIGANPDAKAEYARTKGMGERAVREAFPNATIVRPSIVFGPEDQFFNRFACMARFMPALPLVGGGQTRFQPVYVGDVAEAIKRIVADPATKGQTFEFGGPRVYTFQQLMEFMLNSIGRQRTLISLPWGLASLQARFLELLPNPLLTRDQVEMLKSDNVVAPGAKTLRDLDVQARAVEAIVPTYMDRFRVGGRFAANRQSA